MMLLRESKSDYLSHLLSSSTHPNVSVYLQITAEEIKDNRAIVLEMEAKGLDKKVGLGAFCRVSNF